MFMGLSPTGTGQCHLRTGLGGELFTGGIFLNFAQSFTEGAATTKSVTAIATAGPSPTSPCDLAPLLVCGNPAQYNPDTGMFWGIALVTWRS